MNEPRIINLACKSCGATIKIPPDLETLNCSYCGAAMIVQRGEGFIGLKMAEQVSKSIQDVGTQTQSTIREGTHVTQVELKRLQISQEVSSLQIQLSNVQSEIRSLQRQKADRRIKQQLRELAGVEASLINRINGQQAALAQTFQSHAPSQNPSESEKQNQSYIRNQPVQQTSFCTSPLMKGCLTGIFVFFLGAMICGIPAQALDQAIFHIPMDSSSSTEQTSGPIFSIATLFLTGFFVIGFAYGFNPQAAIWKSLKNKIMHRKSTGGGKSVQDDLPHDKTDVSRSDNSEG